MEQKPMENLDIWTRCFLWGIQNKKTFYSLCVGFCVFTASLFYVLYHRDVKDPIAEAYKKWEQSPSDESAWNDLERLIKQYPLIGKNYSTEIIQKLLTHEISKPSFQEQILSSLSNLDDMPLYNQFSRMNIFLGEKKYNEAKKEALDLKDTLYTQKERYPLLFLHYLFQVAYLEKVMQNKVGEKNALADLEKYVKLCSDKNSKWHEPLEKFFEAFRSSCQIDLKDYLNERKAAL